MAPIAGRSIAGSETGHATVVVADTGGTTYDVSVVQRGRIPTTVETWIGPRFVGHMTGFPSVDVRSVGAGGGTSPGSTSTGSCTSVLAARAQTRAPSATTAVASSLP